MAATAVVAAPTSADAASVSEEVASTSQSYTQQAAVQRSATQMAQAKAAAVSAKARKAVAYAKAHVGYAYRWGGHGPRAFDCSGLTMMAWRQAGVKLPHRAKLQASRGRWVAKSRLRPGDLVFFYKAKSHVGIYIGGGRMVHAANPRRDVAVDRISSGYYAKVYRGARHIA